MSIVSKPCSKCKINKPFAEFNKGGGKFNLKNYCKECDKEIAKLTYLKNREKRIAQASAWNKKHQDKLPIYQKAHRDSKSLNS